MAKKQQPDLAAQIIGSLIVLALGAYISDRLRQHPVLGAAASYVVTALIKPEILITASGLGF